MRLKTLGLMLTAFGLLVGTAFADDESIARHLQKKLVEAKQQGKLKNFKLDMEVKDGVVIFRGRVASKQQKDLVLRTAQLAHNLGVAEIRDGITVKSTATAAVSRLWGLSVKQTTNALSIVSGK